MKIFVARNSSISNMSNLRMFLLLDGFLFSFFHIFIILFALLQLWAPMPSSFLLELIFLILVLLYFLSVVSVPSVLHSVLSVLQFLHQS